jgi:amidase
MGKPSWREIAAKKKQEQIDCLPKDWLIELPPDSQLDVLSVPRQCGLLTEEELEITECHIEHLLSNLASAKWSSYQVTSAFYKRATLAHQLVNAHIVLLSCHFFSRNSHRSIV